MYPGRPSAAIPRPRAMRHSRIAGRRADGKGTRPVARPPPPRSAKVRLICGGGSLSHHLMYDAASRRLEADGFLVARSLVGNHVSSLEMAGCSLTLARLDEELIVAAAVGPASFAGGAMTAAKRAMSSMA